MHGREQGCLLLSGCFFGAVVNPCFVVGVLGSILV